MPRALISFVLVTALASPALAQATSSQPPASNVEQTLRRLSAEWARVPITRDTSVLKRIWAPDCVYVESNGRVFNKAQGIADVAKITDKYASAAISDVKIRVYGATAVVIGDDREIGRDKDGKAFDRTSRFTNVWVLQNGAWHCVSGHWSDLPAK